MKRKPEWLRLKVQGDHVNKEVEALISKLNLNTVCSEASCPNKMECFKAGTATFMILGDHCTRNCQFCNVTTRKPEALDPNEPRHVAEAVKILGLKHAVVTSVDRDDLEDEGANHFAETCRLIKDLNPGTTVELLVPDFHMREDLHDIVLAEEPDVYNHNIEVARRLFDDICPQSDYDMSIAVLDYAKKKGFVTKTGLMVGFGETEEDVVSTMKDLREVDCDMITIGQYLQPSKAHIDVKEYVHPDTFAKYGQIAKDLGFKRVESSPFVRSSYRAQALTEEEKQGIAN